MRSRKWLIRLNILLLAVLILGFMGIIAAERLTPPPAVTTAPGTTLPETTAAPTTLPPTTAPAVTVPETTHASVTEPEETQPEETQPRTVSLGPEDPAGFVLLSDVIPEAILEVRYHTTYNFVGDRIDGYEEPVILITREAAEALKKVNEELMAQGYVIKVFDAYRPQMAVDHFVRWAKDADDIRMKEYFYPELDKSVLFAKSYIASKSGHTRGSTVDLTLFDLAAGKEVDMGGPFDFFGELSAPDYPHLTPEQKENRYILRNAMINNGFRPLFSEWWHFTLRNEPYPNTYFTFPVNSDVVK